MDKSRFQLFFVIASVLFLLSVIFNTFQSQLLSIISNVFPNQLAKILSTLIINVPLIFVSGEILAVLAFLEIIDAKKQFNLNPIFALTLIFSLAFALRSSFQFLYPYYCGWDTGIYVAYTLYFADHFSQIPRVIMRFGNISSTGFPIPIPSWVTLPIPSEPLFYTISAFLVKFGVPAIYIVLVFVPIISTLILVPFFFIVKNLYSEKVALVSTAFLAVSFWQLRFTSDLYNSLFAILMFLCAVYFFFFKEKDKKLPLLTILFATGMVLSSLFISLFFAFVLLASALFDRKIIFKIAVLTIFVTLISSLLTQTIYPLWLYDRYLNVGLTLTQFFTENIQTLESYRQNFFMANIRSVLRIFFPMIPLFFVLFLHRKHITIDKISKCFILAVTGLCTLFLTISLLFSSVEPIDRSLMLSELPLIIIASNLLVKHEKKPFISTILTWSSIFTFNYLTRWFGPSPEFWNYFKKVIGGENMPDVYHPPYFAEWLLINLIFAITIFLILKMRGDKD